MKKFLFTLLCLVAAVGVSVAQSSYIIEFKSNTADASNELTNVNYAAQITSGKEFVSGFSCSKTYQGKNGLKLGTGSAIGKFTLTLSDAGKVKATSIVVKAMKYGSDNSGIKVNGSDAQSLSAAAALTDFTFNITEDLKEITVETTTKRCYVKSITVNYAPAGPVDAEVTFEDLTVEEDTKIAPKYTAPEGLTFTYVSDNEEVVLGMDDEMIAMGVGTANITASWEATADYNAGSANFTVTVTEKDTRAEAGLMFGEETFAAVMGQDNDFPEFVYDTDGAITFTSSNTDVATIDENGTVTLVGEGTTTITATSAATDSYKAGEASYKLTVTDPNKKGTENNPYTVAEALEAQNANGVYVKGYVVEVNTNITTSGQLKYYIADTKDGSTLYIFNGKYLNNDKFTSDNLPEIGSYVVICGDLTVYSGIKELNSNSTLISIERPADAGLAFAEAEYTAALGSDFTAADLVKTTTGTITWTSSNESVATVDVEGKVTLLAVGTTTVTATAEEVFGVFKAGQASYKLTVFSDALGTPECEDAVEGAISTYEGAALTFTAANAERLTVGNTELTDGVYTVAFPENQNSYILTVTAVKGEETLTADFTINRIIPGAVAFSAENGSSVMPGSIITLSCENADRIMWSYTEDGTYAEYTDEGITVDETNSTIFAYGEYKGFSGEIASVAYTMKEVELYTPVTDVNELKAGGRYLIGYVTDKTQKALGKANGKFRDAVNVEVVDGNIVYNESITAFRLVKAGEGWKLRFDNGNYLAQSGADNQENTTGSVYTITINADGNASVTNGNYSICYNSSSPRFKTYASSSNQQPVKLYHLAEEFEAPVEETIYMHGVFADRAWDFAQPVALTLSNDGTYVASNIHIGSVPAVEGESLDYVFSTTMADGGMPHVAGRRNIPAETNWADLGEGTVYHAAGMTKASDENAASEIVPFTAAKAGLYNITADFSKEWPAITVSEAISTGVDNISVADGEVEYYNLQGIRVSEPKVGVYIRRQGSVTTKVVLQ